MQKSFSGATLQLIDNYNWHLIGFQGRTNIEERYSWKSLVQGMLDFCFDRTEVA